MNYYDYATKAMQEMERQKYAIDFSIDMSLREFIQWVLNMPLYIAFFIVILLICLKLVILSIKRNHKD